MLRLDTDTTFKKLPRDIKRHLIADEASSQDKWSMLFCIVVLLDLICGIPLFVNGEKTFTNNSITFYDIYQLMDNHFDVYKTR
ncbi:hypothetical protein [Bacillus haynesii]|uniref:hypothetical protein n=1 Tax=Bacillus haynesii TaxID=1925021 RepID=UPI0003EDA312|nr:hypothetical protein [Bacillus haynesii]EWH22932.1 hypothetical protein M769_0105985 [Bacillus haynesii]